ncbi:hypothetical protein HDU83_004358 [Entophlyctis luteolus]|nr:hypothetical protein HDU83_004358 [Entophlyctis luteolus]
MTSAPGLPPPPIPVTFHPGAAATAPQRASLSVQQHNLHQHQQQPQPLLQQIHPTSSSYVTDYGSLVGQLGTDAAAYYGNAKLHSLQQTQQLQTPASTTGNTPTRSNSFPSHFGNSAPTSTNNLSLNVGLQSSDVLQLQNHQVNSLNAGAAVPTTVSFFQQKSPLAGQKQRSLGDSFDEDFDDRASGKGLDSNEKRARRRASHNAVERRRRDIINEKINELSTLLPDHHLLPADAQNKGSILKRSVDHMRGVQAMAGRQADRIIELENVCRMLMQKAGITDDSELGLSLPLGTSFVLRVSGMPGGEITGNQLAGALLAAAQTSSNSSGRDANSMERVNTGAGVNVDKDGLVNDLMAFNSSAAQVQPGVLAQASSNGLGLISMGNPSSSSSEYIGDSTPVTFQSL